TFAPTVPIRTNSPVPVFRSISKPVLSSLLSVHERRTWEAQAESDQVAGRLGRREGQPVGVIQCFITCSVRYQAGKFLPRSRCRPFNSHHAWNIGPPGSSTLLEYGRGRRQELRKR